MINGKADANRVLMEILRQKNAWQFFADVHVSLVREIMAREPRAKLQYPSPPQDINPPYPKPPCVPPMCDLELAYLRQLGNAFGQNGVAVVDLMDVTIDYLQMNHVDKVKIQFTQGPSYPDGMKMVKLAKANAGALRAGKH